MVVSVPLPAVQTFADVVHGIERNVGADGVRGNHEAAGLGHLPNEDRDLLLRCALTDESYADYGARTATPRSAVKSRAFRARRRLGVLLRDTLH